MLQFPLACDACVVLLVRVMAVLTVPSARFQELASAVGQRDRDVALAVHPDSLHQPLFAEVAKVAAARIGAPSIVVSKLARRHDTEGPCRR